MNDNHMTEACADFLLNLGRWCGLIQGNSPELARLLLNVELGTDPEALKGLAAFYATLPVIIVGACLRAPEWAQAVVRLIPDKIWDHLEEAIAEFLAGNPVTIEDGVA